MAAMSEAFPLKSDDSSHKPVASQPIDVPRLLAEAPIAHVEYFLSIGSTHDVAHELARAAGTFLPCLVVAETQTAGRGRGSNRWWTGGGSLAFSLVFDPSDWSIEGELSPQRSLAVGVAIVETVAPLVPQVRVGLHWPNDVFADGRKIAGVLVDVLAGGRHVVGIGLNVNNALASAPPEVAGRATSLCELAGRTFDRTAVLGELLRKLQQAMQAAATDPDAFGGQFQNLCLQVGRPLTIEAAGRRTTGVCAGIAPDGALLIETATGIEAIYSGVLVH
jgi:BirA family transcriptional regulator, biotin operon repressor / biotin---[acetyl-CoA-carboxylase] ligase